MYKGLKILAIITARGGSKGLPGKNIKEMNGKPLLAWTIEQAKTSKYLDEIFVSTDSEDIAEVSNNYGVDVQELRPKYLATDDASSIDVIEYTIELLRKKGKCFDYLILLEPTSPLRKWDDIDNMIQIAGENNECDGVISVGKVHTEHPMILKKISSQGRIIPYHNDLHMAYQRQQHDAAYFPYGVGYLIKVSKLIETHTIYTDNIIPYYIDRWQNYEVDDIYDFICIEAIMKARGEDYE